MTRLWDTLETLELTPVQGTSSTLLSCRQILPWQHLTFKSFTQTYTHTECKCGSNAAARSYLASAGACRLSSEHASRSPSPPPLLHPQQDNERVPPPSTNPPSSSHHAPSNQHLVWEEVRRAGVGPVYSGRKTRLTGDGEESERVSAC